MRERTARRRTRVFTFHVSRITHHDNFMNILTKATVLVLNRNWQAINVRTPQEAFCMMATNIATALDIEYLSPDEAADSSRSTLNAPRFTPCSWAEWLTLPIRDQD